MGSLTSTQPCSHSNFSIEVNIYENVIFQTSRDRTKIKEFCRSPNSINRCNFGILESVSSSYQPIRFQPRTSNRFDNNHTRNFKKRPITKKNGLKLEYRFYLEREIKKRVLEDISGIQRLVFRERCVLSQLHFFLFRVQKCSHLEKS